MNFSNDVVYENINVNYEKAQVPNNNVIIVMNNNGNVNFNVNNGIVNINNKNGIVNLNQNQLSKYILN